MTELVLDKVKEWLSADDFYAVEDVDIRKYATVFHRNLYTFGENGEIYLKYKLLNKNLKGLDDVVLLHPKGCFYRVSEDEYVETVGKFGEEVAIIGVLSDRFVKKNNYAQYDPPISEASETSIVPIEKFSLEIVGDFDAHLNGIDKRTRQAWVRFKTEISSSYPY